MEVQNVDSRSMSLNSLISSGKNMSILLLALAKLISKQGRPPRNSEKGAVRCCRRAMRGYNSCYGEFTTAYFLPYNSVNFAHFLDPSM